MAKEPLILCDTNIFIQLFRGNPDTKTLLEKIGQEKIALSIITFAEIIYGTRKNDLATIRSFLDRHHIIEIDKIISQTFKDLVLRYSYSHHIKIPDAIIAATAVALNLQLFTENKKDFNFIPEIKFYN